MHKFLGRMLLVVGMVGVMLSAGNGYADILKPPVILNEELVVTEIAPECFLVTHKFPWGGNSLVVKVSPTEVVFVDTPYENQATQRVIEWIRATFGAMQVTEINTGFHWDNLGGNEYLEEQQIPVYGTDLTVQLLTDRAEDTRAQTLEMLKAPKHQRFYDVHKTQNFVAPDHILAIGDVSEGVRLAIGEEQVDVFFPGPSHAPDNLVVYFPTHHVLFGGCMVKALASKGLGFTGDADLKAWPTAIQRVLERYPDAELVIPGHGPVGDTQLLHHTLALLEAHS